MDSHILTDIQAQVGVPLVSPVGTSHEVACELIGRPTGAKELGSIKRRRVSTSGQIPRRSTGRAGKLRHLPEMPLDILFEIFGHLDPFDVLHLARTTKALRGILMSKSARFIWKQARSNLDGFPDCPSDLSEPQYANLAFDPHCHYCLYPHTPRILWACRVRCCKTCLPEEFVPESRLRTELELPSCPGFLPSIYHQPLRRRGQLYSVRHARVLAREYCELLFDSESIFEWENVKRKVLRDLNAHASLCERWHRKWTANRSQELDTIRQRRKEAIFSKLREIGWETEIEKLMAYEPRILLDHTLVKQPKDLTPRIWHNIEPKLISLLESVKAKRLQRERANAINERCRIMATILDAYILTRPLTEAFPSVADVCEMGEVKTIIEDTPIEVVVTKESFTEIAAQLPRLCDDWKFSKNRELVFMMQAEVEASIKVEEDDDMDVDTSCLKLATTWFLCRDCLEPIGYPRVLAHCHAIAIDFRTRRGDQLDTFLNLNCDLWNRGGERIKFHPRVHRAARVIVEACGFDPDVTTADEVDEMDPILECLICRNNDGRLAMRWRRAIYHTLSHEGAAISWALLNLEDRQLAERGEETEYSQILPDLACVHCRLKTSLRNIKDHVRIQHGKEIPTIIDYFFHIDASIHSIPLPVRIPHFDIQTFITSSIPRIDWIR